MTGTTTMKFLKASAFWNRNMTSAVEWLKRVGLIPADVENVKPRQALTDLDPEAVRLDYLAAVAFEWDTWGPASPVDLVKALEAETRGARRDLITETLLSLGRQMETA